MIVTFNAHFPCSDAVNASAQAALSVQALLKVHVPDIAANIGLSTGEANVGAVGYSGFKTMLCVGSPMKVAVALSRMKAGGAGTVFADDKVQHTVRYRYELRPADLVQFPGLGKCEKRFAKPVVVYQLPNSRAMEENEWMYQLQQQQEGFDAWSQAFNSISRARSVEDAGLTLDQWLEGHPNDHIAASCRGAASRHRAPRQLCRSCCGAATAAQLPQLPRRSCYKSIAPLGVMTTGQGAPLEAPVGPGTSLRGSRSQRLRLGGGWRPYKSNVAEKGA